MATNVIIPIEGGGVCYISDYAVKVGDHVGFGDLICSAETDKAVIDVTSPCDGTVLAVLCANGDEVPAFSTVAVVGDAGENVNAAQPQSAAPAAETQEAAVEPAAGQAGQAENIRVSAPANKALVSPRARKYAAEHQIELSGINGTGIDGSITEKDVMAAEATARAAKAAPAPADAKYTVRTLTKMQKAAAQHMMDSLRDSAQFTITTRVNVDNLLHLRKRMKESGDELGLQSVTVNDLFCFAVSRTLPQFPRLNAVWAGDELHEYNTVNLGVAVDTPDGLVVPVIRDAQELTLSELSQQAHKLADKCKAHRQSLADISEGSFSVSNLGSFGVEGFTPIINPPQVAILGIGAPHREYLPENGQWRETKEVSLSLTLDHRAVDGAPGARFLKALCENIEDIDILLSI